MATQLNTNMSAVTLPTDLARNLNRMYLALTATTDVDVTISGGATFTVPAGGVWAPIPTPTNDIEFSGTGVLVVG